ncbi:MAG: hypothetical protein HEQ32_04245 [Vampirovibrio sp.]
MTTRPKLIDVNDVLAQTQVLEGLLSRLDRFPTLPQNPLQAWIFVAEGSSYNAVDWQLKFLIHAHPSQRVDLFYPWELEAFLKEAPLHHEAPPFVIAVSQSGKTASLRRALEHARQAWGRLEGLLITNATSETLTHEHWLGLPPFYLEVGPEEAIAATKTFLATTVTLKALANPQTTLQALSAWIPSVKQALTDIFLHPQWNALLDLVATTMTTPIAVIGGSSVMAVLGEVHLKLTETLSRPVLTYHHEGFKHGPRSILHRQQAHWPLLIYAVPTQDSADFYADAQLHLQHVDAAHAPRLVHLWVRSSKTMAPPSNLLALGRSLDWALDTDLPDDLLLLLLTQCLAVALVEGLHLEADGLSKFVAETPPYDAS